MGARVDVPTVIAANVASPRLRQLRIQSGGFRETPEGLEKRCAKCREYFPADNTAFYATKDKPDGLYDWCKCCYIEWKEEWLKRRAKPPRAVRATAPKPATGQKPPKGNAAGSAERNDMIRRVGFGRAELTVDRGQRFEVRYKDGLGKTRIWGWTDDAPTAKRYVSKIAAHPVFHSPRIVDRKAKALA